MKTIHIIIMILVVAFSCGPSTKIIATWKSPKALDAVPGSILVTALTSNPVNRKTVESDLANALQERGLRALQSIEVFPPTLSSDSLPDKQALLQSIKECGVDGILTIALINKETETRYVPGTYDYAPVSRFGYYGMFWGYYNTWYPTLYNPGYYTEDKTYFIETNLYDAATQELIWSAQSETYNPNSLKNFSEEFSDVVLAKLEDEGLLNQTKI